MKVYKKIIFIFILLFPLIGFSKTIELLSVKALSLDGHTRIIFSFNGSVHYHYFLLKKPNRLVVDFFGAKYSKNIDKNSFKNTNIKSIRKGYYKNNLRVVFELKKVLYPKSFAQKFWKSALHRLIIDLIAKPTTKKKPPLIHKKTAMTKTKIPEQQLREAIVVIDPGHGGKDPGATGYYGTHEKNVVLQVGKDLYDDLRRAPGIHPVLTRRGDYFVTLRGRLALARKGEADIFVAIHADAYRTRDARGASVYALSQRGASSEAAHWLAQKENSSELMGGVDLNDKSYLLRSVLLDLSQTATIRDSLILGADVLQSLGKVAVLHCHRVEQAPFVVLKSPDIPSLLIETGFISNRKEEKLLRSRAYQHKIAEEISKGVVEYLHHHATRDTILGAERAGSIYHIIKKGENLSRIARRYGMRVNAIEKVNGMKNSTLRIGQKLRIPKIH